MTVASPEDIYIQRAEAAAFGSAPIFGYFIMWQTYGLTSIVLAFGLLYRKRLYVFVALAALLIAFLITAAKMTFVIIAYVLFVHWQIRTGDLLKKPYKFVWPPLLVLSFAAVLVNIVDIERSDFLLFFVGQIVMRAIGAQAMIMNAYAEFFASNSFTLYSHVTPISGFIDYPYAETLAKVISAHIVGTGDANANSGFWATDGIAAAGSIGVIIIGLVVGCFFCVVNAFLANADMRFVTLAFIPFSMMIANVSFFTALFSGGGLFVVVFIGLMSNEHWRQRFLLYSRDFLSGR
jgi:hypothetical protein